MQNDTVVRSLKERDKAREAGGRGGGGEAERQGESSPLHTLFRWLFRGPAHVLIRLLLTEHARCEPRPARWSTLIRNTIPHAQARINIWECEKWNWKWNERDQKLIKKKHRAQICFFRLSWNLHRSGKNSRPEHNPPGNYSQTLWRSVHAFDGADSSHGLFPFYARLT